jgi:hypothetical protein
VVWHDCAVGRRQILLLLYLAGRSPNSATNPRCRGWSKPWPGLVARSRRQWPRSGGRWLQASGVQRHRSWEGKALFAWVPSINTRHREHCAIETAAKIRTWNPDARLLSADCIDPKPGSSRQGRWESRTSKQGRYSYPRAQACRWPRHLLMQFHLLRANQREPHQ